MLNKKKNQLVMWGLDRKICPKDHRLSSLQMLNVVFDGEQEKESIIGVRMG